MRTETQSSPFAWPELPFAAWSDTCATLHLWTQVVGKVRLAKSPWINAAFYSYAYPVPAGFGEAKILPEEAYFHETLGEFLLPYDAVRTAAEPDAKLLAFLQTSYEAAADSAGWDRTSLELAPVPPT